jgi:hypothetical protein
MTKRLNNFYQKVATNAEEKEQMNASGLKQLDALKADGKISEEKYTYLQIKLWEKVFLN